MKELPLLEQLAYARQKHDRRRWGYRFLKPHEIQWLTSSGTLRAQIGISLKDRCPLFLRKFLGSHMNPTLLREVYRRHGIRKKKYRWVKVVKDTDEDSRRHDLARMKRQLTMAKNDGYRIIYLDETMFTRKTVSDTEWTLPG